MDHIHLLVSTFDTSNVAVAHNLRSCSRPPSETKTKTRQAETKTETKTGEAKTKTKTKTKTSRVETKTKTKTSKKWSWSVSRPRPRLETHIPDGLLPTLRKRSQSPYELPEFSFYLHKKSVIVQELYYRFYVQLIIFLYTCSCCHFLCWCTILHWCMIDRRNKYCFITYLPPPDQLV